MTGAPRKENGEIDWDEMWIAGNGECIRVGPADWYDFDAFMKAIYSAAIEDAAKIAGEFDVESYTPDAVACDICEEIKELKQ